MINKQELSERLRTGEDSYTEFKTSLDNLESIAGEITAFFISRNPTLAAHAHHMLPYSGVGTGIQRILKHHPATEFEDKRNDLVFLVRMKF